MRGLAKTVLTLAILGGATMANAEVKTIYLAGGCFWGLEAYLSNLPGVVDTEVGYANGLNKAPSYQEVCTGLTGHAETVRSRYDDQVIGLERLVSLFLSVIDPTSVNRQGGDVGTQYRTGVYYENEADRPQIQLAFDAAARQLGQPLAVELKPLENFFPAEDYHQDYLKKNPGGYCHIPRSLIEDAAKTVPETRAYVRPSDEELRKKLSPLSAHVMLENGTEAPFDNEYWKTDEPGIYVDAATGEPLFSSRDKFDSGCGWPAFSAPIEGSAVHERVDASHGMIRTEVRSRAGDLHLGHVFEDGPKDKGGLRYCINSAAVRFIPLSKMDEEGYGAWKDKVK